MDETVSESVTGQSLPKPNREQRDAAFSTGAGRKAVEVPREEQEMHDRLEQSERPSETRHLRQPDHKAPVGLEMETKAENQMDQLLSG